MKRMNFKSSPKKEARGCYLKRPREMVESFEQDCQGCRDLVAKIQSNGQLISNGIVQEVIRRMILSMKCFFYESTGRAKAKAGFSNLCHIVQERGGIVLNKRAPRKKRTI